MILYGSTLSPFVRRVLIHARMAGYTVERRDLKTMGAEFDRARGLSPLGRVPILELDDGTCLADSWAIGDWLDEAAPNGRRLVPAAGTERRDAMQRLALATGVAEKAVALAYERNRRPEAFHWMDWQQRLVAQIKSGLVAMNDAVPGDGWSAPEGPDLADLAAITAWDYLRATNPWVLTDGYPRLEAFAARGDAMPEIGTTRPAI